MARYAKLRGSPHMRSRRRPRTPTIPAVSVLFIFLTSLLAAIFHLPSSSSSSSSSTTASRTQALLAPLVSVRSGSDYGNLCNADARIHVFSQKWFLAILIPGVIFCFVGLAIVTDDYFVAALEQICQQLNLSEDVAGATFMAAGSSTPEFFASMIGVFLTKDDVGVGTIVGSAVFNILVIIGLSAALAGGDLRLDWRPLLRDSVFYVVSILLLFTFTMGSSNGKIDWWEGFILVSTYVVYVLFMAFVNRIYMEKALKLGWFGIVAPDIETGGNNNNESDNNIINNNNNDGDGMMTSVFDGNDGEDDGGQMQQPSLHAFSQSALISMSEDGRKRYRDLNPRTRLRGAQIAVMATIRLASTSSSGTNGDDIDAAVLPSAKRSTTSADPNKPGRHSPNTTGGGMSPSPHDDDGNNNSSPAGNTGDHDGDEGPTLLGIELPRTMFGKIFFPFSLIWKLAFRYTILDCSQDSKRKLWPVTFILSIIWISAISYVMVEASRISGCLLNIPATLMGLTVLAAGTSVPDALASISVARDGAGDMAVSNAIGSNVFDILLGLGFPWMLGSWILSDDIVVDTEHITSVVIPIIILFVIMIAFVGLLIAFKWTMNKWFGYSLFGLYFVFVAYTLLENYVFKFGGSR